MQIPQPTKPFPTVLFCLAYEHGPRKPPGCWLTVVLQGSIVMVHVSLQKRYPNKCMFLMVSSIHCYMLLTSPAEPYVPRNPTYLTTASQVRRAIQLYTSLFFGSPPAHYRATQKSHDRPSLHLAYPPRQGGKGARLGYPTP